MNVKEKVSYWIKSSKEYLADNGDKIFKPTLIVLLVLFLTILLAYYSSVNGGVFVIEKSIIDFWATIIFYFLSLFIGVVFTYYFLSFRRYQFHEWQYLIFVAVLFFYSMLRFEAFETQWRFIELFWIVKALDPFVLMLIIILGVVFKKSNDKKLEIGTSVFLEDNPLESEEDATSYKNLLEQIKPILYTDKYKKSFSVAIVGAWGSGKSSFIDALTKNIENYNDKHLLRVEKQVIHFHFSPFLNHDENSIIKEFFTKLSHVLGKRSGKVSNQLLAYSNKLTNLAKKGDLLSFLSPIQSELFNQSAHELYESISDTIKSLDVKIIITIDDLDRLSGNEILEVLKLIRNTSNFPNTVFFVALDKDYILSTIAKVNINYTTQYLDKFFQIEVSIAKIPVSRVLFFLEDMLFAFLNKIEINDGDNQKLKELFKLKTLEIHISNFRDAKRFYNQFVIDFKLVNQIKEGVDFIESLEIQINDLINLTLLKLYYPKTFNLLFTEELSCFEENENFRILTSGTIEMIEDSISEVVGNYFSSSQINGNCPISKESLKCQYLIVALFGVYYNPTNDGYDVFLIVPEESISNKQVLNRYFQRTNYEGKEMSNAEYLSIIEEGSDYVSRIKTLVKDVILFHSFIQRLKKDKNISLVNKALVLNEILVNKDQKYESIIYYLSLVLCQLHEKQIDDFNKAFLLILNNEKLSFHKKTRFISDVDYELERFGIKLNEEEIKIVLEEVNKGVQFFMEGISFNMKSLNHLYYIWRYFNNKEIKDNFLSAFKDNFKNLNIIDFCEWQLMYKEDDKGFVFKRPIIENMLGSSSEFLELLNAKKDNSDKMEELKKFFKLQSIFEGVKIRFYFKKIILGVGLYTNADNTGEVIFRILSERLFFHFKKSSLFNSSEYINTRAKMRAIQGNDNNFYLIFDIDNHLKLTILKLKEDLIKQMPYEHQINDENSKGIFEEKSGWLRTKDNKDLVDIFSVKGFGSDIRI